MKPIQPLRRPRKRIIKMVRSAAEKVVQRTPPALEMVLGLFTLIGAGTVLLLIPGAAARPLTLMEAAFTSTSASAVTGLSVFTPATTLTFWGQVILMVLAQIGGVSLIVTVSLISYSLGREVSLSRRLTVTSSLGLDNPGQIMRVMIRAMTLMFIIEGVGALLLYLHWRFSGIVPAGEAAFYAIFHAVMTFCNAGFDLFSGLPKYPNGIPSDPISLLIMGFLVILGGLGIPVYMNLIYSRNKRGLSLHTRVTLAMALILILVGWAGLLATEYRQNGVLSGMPPLDRIVNTWFQSVSTRTAGFASLPGFSELKHSSILLIMVLMMIGAGPASTGGGITTGTFAVLMFAVLSYARGYDHIRIGKRSLPDILIKRALVVLVLCVTLVIIATWLILNTNPYPLTDIAFEVVSAFSTTGLSLGITAGLNTFGLWVLMATMFCGRLGAVTIMIAMLGREPRKRLVEFPEESILIG
jgi:trk system potassium uptake protein TrkH